MELTNEDNDFTYRYNKILATYEMNQHSLINNQQKIMQDYKLDGKKWRELFDFYTVFTNKLYFSKNW
jgi:hypothetical protein